MAARNTIEVIIQGRDNLSSVLGGAQQRMQALGQSISGLGQSMAGFSLAAGAALGASVKAATDFDTAMTNVGAVLGKSKADMADLRAEVLALGGASQFGPQATAEAFYDIVGGVADASTHMAILQAAMDTATAGAANLGGTTSALISIMNSYGFEAEQAGYASDVLTRTVGMGVGSMEQFASALPQVTGLANSLSVSFGDIGAGAAFLTTQGNTASGAVTQLTAIMTAMLNPNEKMKAALAELGFTSGQTAVEQLGLYGAINAVADTQAVAQNGLAGTLGSVEALRGATALTGEGFMQFREDFEAGIMGATERAKEIQLESVSVQFQQLGAKVTELAITVGEQLLPILAQLVNEIKPVIEQILAWTKENPEATKTIVALGVAVAAASPVLMLLGGVISGLSSVFGVLKGAVLLASGGFTMVGAAGSVVTGVFGGMAAAATAVLGPVGAAAAAFVALAAAVAGAVAAWNNYNAVAGEGRDYAGQQIGQMQASGRTITKAELEAQMWESARAQAGGTLMSDFNARIYYGLTYSKALEDPTMRAILEGRADGGPVMGGTPYLVGERGPELFVPRSSGSIVPNEQMGGPTYNLSVQVSAEALRTVPQAETNGGLFGQQIMMALREGG